MDKEKPMKTLFEAFGFEDDVCERGGLNSRLVRWILKDEVRKELTHPDKWFHSMKIFIPYPLIYELSVQNIEKAEICIMEDKDIKKLENTLISCKGVLCIEILNKCLYKRIKTDNSVRYPVVGDVLEKINFWISEDRLDFEDEFYNVITEPIEIIQTEKITNRLLYALRKLEQGGRIYDTPGNVIEYVQMKKAYEWFKENIKNI